MRTAILGVGSIGTVLGALITRRGGQVDLIDPYAAHVEALNKKGAILKGSYHLRVPVKALLPDQMTGKYDLVFLLCKQTQTAQAMEWLLPHLHGDSLVCTLQNGIPEQTVARYVGAHRTMGGVVIFGATWLAPGISKCTNVRLHMKFGTLFEIGEIDGSITDRLSAVGSVLKLAGGTVVTDRLMDLRWTKLLMNTTASGMSAALGCTYGDVLDDPRAMAALAMIGDETARVAHACGRSLLTVNGSNYEDTLIEPGQRYSDKVPFYDRLWNPGGRALKASMLQDLEKGQATEIDFINGAVCSGGREHGIPTPFNDVVVSLVKAAEQAKNVPDKAVNMRAFDPLIDAL